MVDLKNGTTEHYQNIVMYFVDSSGWSLQNSLKFELLKSFSLQPVVSRNGRNQFAIRQADKFVSTDPDIGAYYPSWCQAAVSRIRVRVPNYAYREKARVFPLRRRVFEFRVEPIERQARKVARFVNYLEWARRDSSCLLFSSWRVNEQRATRPRQRRVTLGVSPNAPVPL